MALSGQRRLLPSVLRVYRKFLPAPKFKDIISRPQTLESIPVEMVDELKDCMISALKEGMPDFQQANILLDKYSPFSEAVASPIVGEIDARIRLVAKVGGEELKSQIEFIEKQEPWIRDLYPAIRARYESRGMFGCLLELLSDYHSFHDIVFGPTAASKGDIAKALDCITSLFMMIYERTLNRYRVPSLSALYMHRIVGRVNEAKAALDQFCASGSLLDSTIEIDGVLLEPYNNCVSAVQSKLPSLGPSFTTLVHGDAHPGNIMLRRIADGYEMKFLDPNPYIEQSDYLYDIGKMMHWLDKVGLLILERQTRQQIVSVDVTPRASHIRVSYRLVDRLVDQTSGSVVALHQIEDLRKFALDYTRAKAHDLADRLGDESWRERLDLSTASAYLGGVVRLTEPTHLMLVFVEGLRYLNRLLCPQKFQ